MSETRHCGETVWDGPYPMTCARVLVNGRCGRHGCVHFEYEQIAPGAYRCTECRARIVPPIEAKDWETTT